MKLPVTIKDQTIEVDIPEEKLIAAGWKKPVSKGRWKPAINERYFFASDARIEHNYFIDDAITDNAIIASCLVYKTREEAKKALARQKAIIRVNDRIDELNDGWEPEWGDEERKYNFLQHRVCWPAATFIVDTVINYESPRLLNYCKSNVVAEQIIRECEADLKVIFEV